MVKLKKEIRKSVINEFQTLLTHFPEDVIVKEIEIFMHDKSKPNSHLSHLLFIENLRRYDFSEITDIELILLCGKFDYEFPAGKSYFNPDQTKAINSVNDAIFKMRHSENK